MSETTEVISKTASKKTGRPKKCDVPGGRVKIMEALKFLLEQKGFQDITWREIAAVAGVSEALIYQYFKTRRGLLYVVLAEYLSNYKQIIWQTLDDTHGALNKISALITGLLNVYSDNYVFARILLLEVRNFQDYYESEAYKLVREYAAKYLLVFEEGTRSGEIRNDISPAVLRQILLGAVEHAILPYVIFHEKVDTDMLGKEISRVLRDAVKCPD